jgi:glucans biosynthesis protein
MNDNPSDYPMNRAKRCGARNRRGMPCGCPALKGRKRCRLHGGHSPGAPLGNRYAYVHGLRSGEDVALRRALREMRESLRVLSE